MPEAEAELGPRAGRPAGDSARRIRRRVRDAERATAAEEERRRVGHELHATIGAALSEVALWHDVAARADAPQAALAVARARARAREALDELRTTVQGLGGGAVAPEALEGRLRRRLAGLAEASGVGLAVSVRGEAPVPAMRAYHLQKLVEEAALNAIRHARPRRVEIDVALEPLRASIVDDGDGFDPGAAPPGHGLGALAAHAAALGVPLDLRSATGRGTEITVGGVRTERVA